MRAQDLPHKLLLWKVTQLFIRIFLARVKRKLKCVPSEAEEGVEVPKPEARPEEEAGAILLRGSGTMKPTQGTRGQDTQISRHFMPASATGIGERAATNA